MKRGFAVEKMIEAKCYERREGELNKEHKVIIHTAFYHPQAMATGKEEGSSSVISEDEKVTLRIAPARPAADRLMGNEAQTEKLCSTPSRNESAKSPRSRKSDTDKSVCEIHLGSLSATDEILIETARSVYSFTVTNPSVPSGRLLGGILGNRLVNASLLPVRSGSSRSAFARSVIKIGSRLIFLIERGNSLRRLTTSAVTRLQYRKKGKGRSPSASARTVSLEHLSGDKSDK